MSQRQIRRRHQKDASHGAGLVSPALQRIHRLQRPFRATTDGSRNPQAPHPPTRRRPEQQALASSSASRQPPDQSNPADTALNLFERASWDRINLILEREDTLARELEDVRRSHAARIEIKSQPNPISNPGPMTGLIRVLLTHTLDSKSETQPTSPTPEPSSQITSSDDKITT